MPPSSHRIEIQGQFKDLPGVRRFIRLFCNGDTCRPLAGDALWQLELAVHEAATNIIRHAYQNRKDRRILIEIQASEERLMVHLNHWGTPFIPKHTAPQPIFDGKSESGFGLYLIRQCVDEVFYECTPTGKNTISLLKRKTRVTPKKSRAQRLKQLRSESHEF